MNARIIFFITFVLFGIISCNTDLSVDSKEKNRFGIEYDGDSVIVSGANLSISNVFREPVLDSCGEEKGTWAIQNTTKGANTFASIEGILRSDFFKSESGQIERKTWISKNKDLIAFQHVYTNTTGEDIKLNALYPFFLLGSQDIFGTGSQYRILTQKTEKNGLPVVVSSENEKIINSDPFLIINDSVGSDNLFVGSQSYYLHMFELNLAFDVNDKGHQIKTFEGKCNFGGVTVPADSSRQSQWIVVSRGNNPHELISDFTGRTNKLHGREKPEGTPPSVYCEFYYYGLGYNEEYFKSDIAAFKADRMPFDIFQIDACWQQNYGHDFEFNESVFPSGMKSAADQIKSLGYKPGIWTAPYIIKNDWSNPKTDIAKNHPEWLLKNSKGELCTWLSYYILDPTCPGVTGYLEDSYRKLADDWGFEYFKFDFMRAIFSDPDAEFYDKCSTSLEAYRKGLEAIKRGVGDSYISVCGGHYGASYGIANSQRSGSDTRSEWDEGELPKYRQNILRTWMSDYWHVDPDAMSIRRQKTALPNTNNKSLGLYNDEEAKTNTLNQFIGGGMVCFGEDFSKIDHDRKALYRHVIPSVNSPSKAVDIYDSFCPNLMLTRIDPVCKDLPSWTIISIINWSDSIKNYAIKLDESITGVTESNQFIVSEFFTQEVLGLFKKGQTMSVYNQQPHQSQLFRVMPWNGQNPVLVNTDLHFSGGGVEISDWKTDGREITGTINTRWNYPINIIIAFPDKGDKGYSTEIINIPAGERNFSLSYK